MPQYYCGTLFDAPTRHELRIVENGLICVGDNGLIEQVLSPSDANYTSTFERASTAGNVTIFPKGQFLLPGFVDLHIHAPQWPQLGKALDRSLEAWLQECTFPLEAKFSDVEFATTTYNSLVSALLANGTTTAVYFGSVHLEATLRLAEICVQKGQRAIVGRVAMDLPDQCPEYYRDPSPQEAITLSERFVEGVRMIPNNAGLVLPSIVPRFIPSCSDEALKGLGELAAKLDCHVQTHCSESDWEHNHVLQRCGKHDAFALDDFKLLTRRTVLAHSNFLSEDDMALVKERGSAVAHCALSNVYFSNAVFPLKRALDLGLHVGTGTDISGGPTASTFDVCRHVVASSRQLECGVDPDVSSEERRRSVHADARVNHLEAFHVATAKGGEALDLPIGLLQPGYYFDAIVVDTTAPSSGIYVFEGLDSLPDIFQKIMYNANEAAVVKTFVNGKLVHELRSC